MDKSIVSPFLTHGVYFGQMWMALNRVRITVHCGDSQSCRSGSVWRRPGDWSEWTKNFLLDWRWSADEHCRRVCLRLS